MKKYLLVLFIVLFCLSITSCKQEKETSQERPDWVLVIHGGAGTILKENMTPEKEKAYLDKLAEALQAGSVVLKENGTSLDAVTAAIMVMEDSPLFNAGKGAVFTAEGINEMDASIMSGIDLKAGSVAGIRHVKNPILAARAVMEKTSHVMLVGKGAEELAAGSGIEMVDSSYFFTQSRYDSYLKAKEKAEKFGTVGAVALDKHGNLAAGTSTGGMTYKMKGRVGDSPVIGAGTYADNNTCAVSATGHGEYFIRNVVAYDISAQMKYKGLPLEAAAERVIMQKLKAIGGGGGIISVDKNGNVAMPFNTPGMYRGYLKSDGSSEVLIYGDTDRAPE
jgi:beta-aspartyl-peptidase (threonine type)